MNLLEGGGERVGRGQREGGEGMWGRLFKMSKSSDCMVFI